MTDTSRIPDPNEQDRARSGAEADFHARALARSATFRKEYFERLNVVASGDMPMERTADGLVKHIIHEDMNTKECCIDIYMQFIAGGGATGTSRHLSEEIAYVVEGSGHDLHWDVRFDCTDAFEWSWENEPKRFSWKTGDFIYIPPYCIHKRINDDPRNEARVIVVNSRIVRAMGFDWFDQLEPAEGFEDLWVPPKD